MSLDATGWVITDGRGLFLASDVGGGWVPDPLRAAVFREMWAAVERSRATSGIVLPWAMAVQVGARSDSAEPAAEPAA